MKRNITYQWGQEHLLIDLGSQVLPRIRVLFWGEFLFTTGMASIFLLGALPLSNSPWHMLAGIGAAMLYILASYRFISRIFYTERLLLDPQYLIIIERTPFRQRHMRYSWDAMGPLHYTGTQKKTDHPLKGKCFDYFGLETHEQLTQSLHQDGNIYFNYEGYAVRFARGVYSWNAEEVVRMMQLYTGSLLRLGPEWARMVQEQDVY